MYTTDYKITPKVQLTKFMFSPITFKGIPVLNMNYSGAIKTGIYGIFLRYFRSDFSVFSWRLLGIIFVSAGILIFSFILYPRLSLLCLLLFLFFFLTDITIVLTTRHDWGPVALALLIRLLFIATWIYGETKESTSISNSFILGGLLGLAIFEKLSSVVLVLPLIFFFLFSFRRRTLCHCLACLAGFTLCAMPLIILNLASFYKYNYLISLASSGDMRPVSFSKILTLFGKYFSLGAGTITKDFILGTASITDSYIEGYLLGSILILTAIIDVLYWKQNKFFRLSGIMLLCYISVAVSLYMLPAPIWVHHLIIGTPFQYAAISLAFLGIINVNTTGSLTHRNFRFILISLLIILIIPRSIGIASIEKSFKYGQSSIDWDPSLTKIGCFASSRTKEAIFIAADWGVATQIFCLSNGHPDFVYELFWNYKGKNEIIDIIEKSGKKILYIVTKEPRSSVNPTNTDRILQDINTIAALKEIPVEEEVTSWKAVKIKKFLYITKNLTY